MLALRRVAAAAVTSLALLATAPHGTAVAAATTVPLEVATTPATTQPVAPDQLEPVEAANGAEVEKASNSARDRVAYAAVALAVLGVVMVGFTVWLWRTTRPLPPALSGLAGLKVRRRRP
jgi:hypothetical protein